MISNLLVFERFSQKKNENKTIQNQLFRTAYVIRISYTGTPTKNNFYGNNGHKLFIFHHENENYSFSDRI